MDRALTYLEKAGEAALREGAYQEAANFLGEALALERETGKRDGDDKPARRRRARWEHMLSYIFQRRCDLTESKAHELRAQEIIGQSGTMIIEDS